MKLQATNIFKLNHNAQTKIVMNRGGSRSSKTSSLIQLFLLKCITEPNKRFIVVRKTLAILKDTFIFEMQEWIDNMEIGSMFQYNKQNASLYCYKTRSSIKFIGADEPKKFRGLEANYWLFNEANEIDYAFFQQAILRMSRKSDDGKLNRFFLDFNPSSRYSWVKTKVEDVRDDVTLITSTYRDNPFLPMDAIREIELLKETDPDAYSIYGLGDYTDIIGAIYKDFKIVDEFPKDAKRITYSLDFGFSNDKTAITKIGLLHGELFIEELLYEKGLTNPMIAEKFKQLGFTTHTEIICDSVEPKSIQELYNLGFKGVKGVKKGSGSINYGISTVKSYKLNICRNSHNLLRELALYKWVTDKDGIETNVAIDKNNDLCDAMRYGIVTNFAVKGKGGIKVF